MDPKLIDWKQATCLYAYGIEHYMNKQDMYHNDDKSLLLLNKNKIRYFDRARRVFFENQIISEDPIQIRKETFSSSFVQNQIERELAKPIDSSKKQTQAERKEELI